MAIAARLVEVVSGRPFPAHLDAAVFEPLGLAVALPEPAGFGQGSGGLPGLLSPQGVRDMRTPSQPNEKYALGWELGRTERGAPLLEHGGDLFTSTAHQALLPDSGYGVAVMANTGMAFSDAHTLMAGIVAILEGGAPRPPATQPTVYTDALFALLTLVTVALAARGLVRARRWAARHGGRRWWRLTPYLAPLVLCLTLAPIHRVLARGRDTAWIQLVYLYPTFMLWLVVASAAGLLVVAARLRGVAKAGRKRGRLASRTFHPVAPPGVIP